MTTDKPPRGRFRLSPSGRLFADRDSFAVDFMNTVVGRYVSAAIVLVRVAIVPPVLGPKPYGLWRLLMVVDDFSRLSSLGTVSALPRQIPYYEGRGESQRAARCRSTALTVSLVGGLVTAIGLAVAAIVVQDGWIRVTLGLFAAFNLLNRFVLFFGMLYEAERRFGTTSKIRIIQAVLSSSVAVFGAALFGLAGLIVTSLLINLAILYLYLRNYEQRIPLGIDREELKASLAVGVPLMLSGMLNVALRSIDRLMVAALLGVRAVGLFSLGASIADRMDEVPWLVGAVAMPRLAVRFGKQEKLDGLRRLVMIPAQVVGLAFPLIVLVGVFGSEVMFRTVWKSYASEALTFRIQIMATMFVAVYGSYRGFFPTIKKQGRIVVMQAAALGLNVVGNYVLIRLGYGVKGAAFSTAVCLGGFSIAQTSMALHFFDGLPGVMKGLGRVYFGPVAATALVAATGILVPTTTGSLAMFLGKGALAIAVYSVLALWVASRAGLPLRRLLSLRDAAVGGGSVD